MNLNEKLLEIQKSVDAFVKDGKNLSDKYDYTSGELVVQTIRPLMNEQKLLLIPGVTGAAVHEGTTRSGTARYLTEMFMTMTWVDVESGEKLEIPWYAQGVDLAGEKGVGKAQTYAEKYFLLKFFHVPTQKDDPDNDRRTGTGELRQKGTAAEKETADYHRAAIGQMLSELYAGDAEKIRAGLIAVTKSEKRGYAGADDPAKLTAAAAAATYAKVKKSYEQRLGKPFELKEEQDDGND